jgi:hypothetical protein
MAQSQRGVKIGQGVSRSAEGRTCPQCGRRGALVSRKTSTSYVTYCHWVDRGLCTYGGISVPRY